MPSNNPTVWPDTINVLPNIDTAINLSALLAQGGECRAWRVQNNTDKPNAPVPNVVIYVSTDAPATQGTIAVVPGQSYSEENGVSVLHLYHVAPSGLPLNGALPGITLWGIA